MNVIDEYLIRLGAVVDQSGMRRFENALRDASALADNEYTLIAKSLVKTQTEIVAGFAAIGTATVGLVDKVAMADQEYRLFALHMYMSKDAARGLKVAMDALGQPLENLTWDPELRARTRQLLEDQRRMAPQGDFEAQMRKIRDVRFEFTRMEVELQYLGMHVVQDFMKALGVGPDTLLKKLRGFNDWIIRSMPEISDRVVTDFLPVWRQTVDVLRLTADLLGDVSVDFDMLVATLSGDDSIDQTNVSMEGFAKSLSHVVFWLGEAVKLITGLEKVAANTAAVVFDLGKALTYANPFSIPFWSQVMHGKNPEAVAKEALEAAANHSVKVARGLDEVGGAVLPGDFYGDKFGGGTGQPSVPAGASKVVNTFLAGAGSAEQKVAALLKDPIIRAMMNQESGGDQNAVSSKGAIGLMQLMPKTAKDLGVNPYDQMQNVAGGAAYIKTLLTQYHNALPTALAAYNAGPGRVNQVLAGKATLPAETIDYVARIMGKLGNKGDVHVGSVVIHIKEPGATPQEIHRAVMRGIQDATGVATQRNLAELQDPAWSY